MKQLKKEFHRNVSVSENRKGKDERRLGNQRKRTKARSQGIQQVMTGSAKIKEGDYISPKGMVLAASGEQNLDVLNKYHKMKYSINPDSKPIPGHIIKHTVK